MKNNPKQRNIYFLGIGAAIVLVVGGLYVASRGAGPQASAGASVVGAPQVTVVPGSSTNGQYNKEVQEVNANKAKEALQNGGTFVPTLTNEHALTDKSAIDEIERQRKIEQEKARAEQEKIAAEQEAARLEEEKARQASQPAPVMPVAVNTVPVQQPVAVHVKKEKYSADDALLIATLSGAAHSRSTSSEFDFARQKPNKEVTATSNTNVNNAQASASNTNNVAAVPLAKAGTVFNAILETAINSDEPSPVLARIVSGELKGTRLIGQIQTVGEKVVIQFSTANIPNLSSSVRFSGFAVNPDSARTALADNVDHHYFLKYGVLLAASFVSGYADALRQNNSEIHYDALGQPYTIPQGNMSAKQINREALGSVGRTLATDSQQQFANLKPTITVNSGSAIGILLVDDLVIKN